MPIICAYVDRNCDNGCIAYRVDRRCQRLVNDENIINELRDITTGLDNMAFEWSDDDER